MMTIETTQNGPLNLWDDGSIRFIGSRVTLDSVMHHFKLGATAEQIAHKFPSVSLADIYAAITYYLHHRAQVEEYLRQREVEENAAEQRIESDPRYQGQAAEMTGLLVVPRRLPL